MSTYADSVRECPYCRVMASTRVYVPIQIAKGAITFTPYYDLSLRSHIKNTREHKARVKEPSSEHPWGLEVHDKSKARAVAKQMKPTTIDDVITAARKDDDDHELDHDTVSDTKAQFKRYQEIVKRDKKFMPPKPKGTWTDPPKHLRGKVIIEDVTKARMGLI